jgi:hypothetical protein
MSRRRTRTSKYTVISFAYRAYLAVERLILVGIESIVFLVSRKEMDYVPSRSNNMNIKVTIELDGTTAEVGEWLKRFGITDSEPYPIAVEAQPRPALASGEPSTLQAERLVRRITKGAREALWHIANHAPEISFDELQAQMSVDGVQLGGIMASFGFAENVGLSRPFRVDKRNRRYLIDEEVAALFLPVLREQDQSLW